MKTPVAMVGYSRGWTLSRSLDRIAECAGVQDRDIYLYLDAPGCDEDVPACDEMRQVAEAKRATALPRLHVIRRMRNYGVPGNIIGAITEVVNRFGRVIFLEDDVCVSRTFLTYMDEALDLYEADARIFCINGHHPVTAVLPLFFRDDVFLTLRNHAWGFGIWKDRWNAVDFEMRDWEVFKEDPRNLAKLTAAGCDLREMVEDQLAGRIHTWDVQCTFHMVQNGLFAVEPRRSMTKNIGFGENAVHCVSVEPYMMAARYYDFQPELPKHLTYHKSLTNSISHALVPQTLLERLHRKRLAILSRARSGLSNEMPMSV